MHRNDVNFDCFNYRLARRMPNHSIFACTRESGPKAEKFSFALGRSGSKAEKIVIRLGRVETNVEKFGIRLGRVEC